MSREAEMAIAGIIYLIAEFCKYSFFTIRVMGGKPGKLLHMIAVSAIFLIAAGVLERFVSSSDLLHLPLYFFLLIFPVLVMQGSIRHRCYLAMLSFSFISVLNTICQILISNLFSVVESYSAPILAAVWFEFCTIWLFLPFFYILYRMIGPKEPVPPDPPLSFLAIAALDVCCSFYIMFTLTYISTNLRNILFNGRSNTLDPGRTSYVMCSVCLVILGIMFLVASLFFHVLYAARRHYRKLIDTQEKYITLQTYYYDQRQHNYQDMRAFRHDLKNHLAVISQLQQDGRQEALTEYIQKLDQSLQKNTLYCDCGHSVASALVSYTALRAKDLGISFTCAGHLPESQHIDSIDLCTVLGNILDNALESCEHVRKKTAGSPFIDIRFLYKNSHTIIMLQNSTVIQSLSENAPLSTLKTDGSDHGIGMQNVAHVLQKYDASLCWSAKDYVFYTEIIL